MREAFPKLKWIVVEEALASNAPPPIRLLEELSLSYLLVAKPTDHADRFDQIKEYKKNQNMRELETIDSDGIIRRYNDINNLPLNASNPDLLVNF